ncbi:MAG: isocitrate/isopropylmalate family dehydrogenase, partial [Actinomycetes bacterium]
MAQRIAVIPGDGIGGEVVASAVQVLDTVCDRHGIHLAYEEYDWSCRRYLETGAMMPEDGLD